MKTKTGLSQWDGLEFNPDEVLFLVCHTIYSSVKTAVILVYVTLLGLWAYLSEQQCKDIELTYSVIKITHVVK